MPRIKLQQLEHWLFQYSVTVLSLKLPGKVYCDFSSVTCPSTELLQLSKCRQYSYKSNIQECSRNHYCHRKAISIKHSERVSVCVCVYISSHPACNAHAPYYTLICVPSSCAINKRHNTITY